MTHSEATPEERATEQGTIAKAAPTAEGDGLLPPQPSQSESSAVRRVRTVVAPGLPPATELSPVLLAYIGDAVYELHVRCRLLMPPKRIRDYHQAVVAWVRAESQSALLERWQPLLTEAEADLVRRGRNATSRSPRRLSPAIYQRATGLETLIGYLFLSDPARLDALFAEFPDEPPGLASDE